MNISKTNYLYAAFIFSMAVALILIPELVFAADDWTTKLVTKGNSITASIRVIAPVLALIGLLVISLIVMSSKNKSFGDYSHWLIGAFVFLIAGEVVNFLFGA